ncbi:nucleotidyltransferase family protein [Rhodococcus sp. ARC_M5]|uniref:nucleotidyltransferase family protein n=1 Tax=Rhodococcus sp. ARC_M5 TaxID=2928851 RepID=UPI001FB3F734|nr:nucleotidyltransferase family protein [Rhodococcus sp. ARC_M5]MCJ0892865.1 nucleotidyltransferase family protein [Rhodococcus sp. ARC_M5]
MTPPGETEFVSVVRSNPAVDEILRRAPQLGLPEWYLTAGGLFQTVWNHLAGRDLRTGIRDYDFFYFDDSDLSYDAENEVIEFAASVFADLGVDVEVRNEARVHLWYEQHFASRIAPFHSTEDAIDHFVSTTCCYGITTDRAGTNVVYAPHGFDDLFAGIVRPNPRLPMRHVYEAKAARWTTEWPNLTVLPWP